jgi:hypothetical protein
MKHRPSLALLEQIVMLLVFAVAAVVCLQAFVWSAQTSKTMTRQDRALILAQNAAETLKHTHDPDETARLFENQAEDHGWTLHITPTERDLNLLSAVTVEVWEGERCLARLPVAWQEVPG